MKKYIIASALTLMIPSIYAEIPSKLYLAGNNGAQINGTTIGDWQLANPMEITTGGNVVLEAKNLEYFKLSETKGSSNGDWSGFNSGVWGPAEIVRERNFGKSMSFVKGGRQFDCPWKGDWTIEISADLSTIKYSTTTPAPEFYLLPGLDNFNNDSWKMEKETGVQTYWIDVTDANSLKDKWVYFAIKAEGNFWTNRYWQIGAKPEWNKPVQCVYWTSGAVQFSDEFTGTVKLDFENTQQWGTTVYVTFYDKIMEHKSPRTSIYVAGVNTSMVNGIQLGNWNITSPVEVKLVDDKFTLECMNISNIDISLEKANSSDQAGWDLWAANRICPSVDVTESNLGTEIAVNGPGNGENNAGTTKVPYLGNYIITIDKELRTMTVTEKESIYHLYHDGNWDNFAQDQWKFEKEEGVDNVYWLDVSSLGSSSNLNIMKDGSWNHWWTSPVRPANLLGEEMDWVHTPASNPEGKMIPDGSSYTGTIRIEAPKEAGSNSILKARFFPSFIEHNSNKIPTGIEETFMEDDVEPEYYNMQGLRVLAPERGNIYIVRQGSKVKKVVM